MRGNLYIQRTKTGGQVKKPAPILCDLTLDGGNAFAFAANSKYKYVPSIVGKLTRAIVSHVSADGLMIHGLEESGPEHNSVLRYQEWWFIPTEHNR